MFANEISSEGKMRNACVVFVAIIVAWVIGYASVLLPPILPYSHYFIFEAASASS